MPMLYLWLCLSFTNTLKDMQLCSHIVAILIFNDWYGITNNFIIKINSSKIRPFYLCKFGAIRYDYDYDLIQGKGDACKPAQYIVALLLYS